MEIKRFFIAVIAVGAVIIMGAALATPSTAGGFWIMPLTDLSGDMVEAGSPFGFTCQRAESVDYYKILAFLENKDGEGPYQRVSISGYYYLNPEGSMVSYALWIPSDTPTGKYDLRLSVQGHVWVYDS
ncbi:MAG: hypothetical protein PHY30_03835, partial [Candidatus Pacebacteria bacterium]|nr:hypothetical protein [Candidatus Paceibacterota bacterium]